MPNLKIAILGASGIGKYHAREYKNAGCEVVAILGSSKKKAEHTANTLEQEFGIFAHSYYRLESMLKLENIDAVSICTPPELHSEHVRKCLEANLHVLCEKPFIFDSLHENYGMAKELIKISNEKKKILTVNTQWPSVLEVLSIKKMGKINNFSMYMEPPGFKKTTIIAEAIPHMNSMLIRLIGRGEATNFRFHKDRKSLRINFDYKDKKNICKVTYCIKPKQERPRAINFSINGERYQRILTGGYKQKITNREKEFEIEDPLKVSIKTFIGAINGKNQPLISKAEILKNVKLQDMILERIKESNLYTLL